MRPGYKQTEVGVIPEEWELRGLLSAVRIANGQVDPRVEPFRSMVLVAPDHIESGTGKLLDKQTAGEQRAISGKYRFDAGDIVYSKIRPYLRKAILADFEGLCSADMYPLKPASDVASGFVLPTLLAHRYTKYAESVSARSGMPKINRAEMADFVVALPPLPEQRAIAKALSGVDALLGGLDRLLAKKRHLKQAAMQQLLTGKVRLLGFSGAWENRSVAEAGDVLAGKALDVNGPGALRPYLRTKNVLDGRIDLEDVLQMPMTDSEFARFRIEPGDVLLNEGQSLELVGRCSIYCGELGSPCAMQNQLLRFRAHPGTCPQFSAHVFRHCQRTGIFAVVATQTTSVAHLGSSRLMNLRLLWPSDPLEQAAIADVLTDIDAEIAALEQRCDKTHALKQAMMQELLAGRTRLVNPEAVHA